MKYILITILIASTFMACEKDKEISDNPTPINNLINNASFEINGKGSVNGWNLVKDFRTFPDTFSNTVPVGGGQFSLRLEGTKDVKWNPYAETYITNISGKKIISLSAYIRSLYGGQDIYLSLYHIRGGQVIDSKSDSHLAFNDWKKFSVIDTLSLQNQDSLRVKIMQSTSQNSGAYIDLVELTTN
ncbi:MAG: hypothetical protein V4538_07555 [Bacteroidota bacterium]